MGSKLTPFLIQKYLSGLRYPTRRHEIVRRALEKGAGEQVIGALRAIPDRWYPSPVELSRQIGHPERTSPRGGIKEPSDPEFQLQRCA